jgi:hypothetical protein
MVDKLKSFGWKILKIAPTDISTTAWRGEAEKRLEWYASGLLFFFFDLKMLHSFFLVNHFLTR